MRYVLNRDSSFCGYPVLHRADCSYLTNSILVEPQWVTVPAEVIATIYRAHAEQSWQRGDLSLCQDCTLKEARQQERLADARR